MNNAYGLCKLSHRAKFVDRIRVYTKGGSGGQGIAKYGGLGGDGGNVVMVADSRGSLYEFITQYPDKRFLAKNGKSAKRLELMGDKGDDIVVKVPPGVVITRDDGTELADLNVPGDRCIVSKGGEGGGPHNDFNAFKGQAHSVKIDLKLLADAGLVGFPNAGKSTFLSAISRAKPKIADYPFTTIRPQLGVAMYEDNRRISLADLPGLIEGAHMNHGMGHYFLKHVERTKVLIVVVDINGFKLNLGSPFRDAFETTVLLNKELELYKASLLDKPHILLINKMDTDEADEKFDKTVDMVKNMADHMHKIPEEHRPSKTFDFKSIIPMSAVLEENIDVVKRTLREVIEEEYTADDQTVQEKLQAHIKLYNEEMAEVKLT